MKLVRLTALSALVGCLLCGALAGQAGAAAPDPQATASKACGLVGAYRSFPPASYVNSLTVRGASCAKGKSVIGAYHRCRGKNGGANGRCGRKVQKFKCSEGTRMTVPGVQYSATVTCKRGDRRIVSAYTQNI